LKIQRKLLLSYLLIVALFVAVGSTVAYNTMKMAELQNEVKAQVDISNNAFAYQQGIDQKKFGAFVYSQGNTQAGEQMIVDAENIKQPAETYLATALTTNPDLLTKFTAVSQIDHNPIDSAIASIYGLTTSDSPTKFTEIQTQLGYLMMATAQVDLKLGDFRGATIAAVQSATVEAQNYSSFSQAVAFVSFAAIAAVSIALAAYLGKRITNPLKKLTDVAGKVSMGDLNQQIDIKTKDEINDLGEAFQRMINAFKMTVALSQEPSDMEMMVEKEKAETVKQQ
jgi:methyl-accepting chemotaxis protein